MAPASPPPPRPEPRGILGTHGRAIIISFIATFFVIFAGFVYNALNYTPEHAAGISGHSPPPNIPFTLAIAFMSGMVGGTIVATLAALILHLRGTGPKE